MDLELIGKIVLVTGSTAGIGFVIAKSLASEGAHIYVDGRTRQRVDAAMAAIRSHAACSPIRDGFVFSGVIMNGAHKCWQPARAEGVMGGAERNAEENDLSGLAGSASRGGRGQGGRR